MIQKTSETLFIQKLFTILQNKDFSQIIRWDPTGTMIDIISLNQMETQIFPKFFRHRKFASFVRQLNCYGFKKIKVDQFYRFWNPLLSKGKKLQDLQPKKRSKKRKCKETNVQEIVELDKDTKFPYAIPQVYQKPKSDYNTVTMFNYYPSTNKEHPKDLQIQPQVQFGPYLPTIQKKFPQYYLTDQWFPHYVSPYQELYAPFRLGCPNDLQVYPFL